MGDRGGRYLYIPFLAAKNQAASTRDYVDGVIEYEPWSLTLAKQCLNMVDGTWLHYPEPGSALEQDAKLMNILAVTRRAWLVWAYKPANSIKWTPEDRDFMAWIDDG